MCVQTDLKELPPIIANRVLKRQPLNAFYIKDHLTRLHQQQQSATDSLPLPLPQSLDHSCSGRHHEEPLSINAFTNISESEGASRDTSQSCWRSAQASNHTDRDKQEVDEVDQRKDQAQPLDLTDSG